MGFFDYIFGSNAAYSSEMKAVSREQIRMFVSQSSVRTLDSKEEDAIEDALATARQDGKISLQKVDKTLQSLVSKRVISINDKKGVFTLFEQYFESR
ncbi:MAG: hypothetical protein UV82_C0009G0022 [Candidatus Magasanikbacteria bacterium GW2011_GWD2_43_18]|uniref:Uncharacterized protein n=1 Tax=Candidatus Magasanikbacteria bacterium GW2011_GWE2_42_7 TaxID=1619052 RepID=A0A0G1BCP2_9BACT|nr:MAG: hypothetical protein UV18_C0004G0106 [Candidatus Magasanikbacteria bacterium GW2011_GWC2_42_27]KKS71120.1 MAG: hypothetical protein UV42_C0036G0016 [Candidatus Magasanikbacteria bacterium GW2011_GWE2_42_7]KKT04283.1 MAG: hypothetical protein UV82_C0009G0022 [Candidatus Magasanikbacteria bacterium GW2011_GWD2_43_18]KKT24858.1 MAG: hypothetical protein UW10_C0018G0010 [Candidatus Magasanikbacteria bacterium GW2011_GWA2_43_9]HBB38373.1 hypothetical protein [Candidatus Magasanikbacteria bac